MPEYADKGHRPHAVHTGEKPRNPITRGPESITVTLDTWGPREDWFTTMYDALQSNWGESPSRSGEQDCRCADDRHYDDWPHVMGWCRLTEEQKAYVESCFAGKTLPQILEGLSFTFTLNGVSRAFTHQNVRTRLGAAFMQHGGRDNDWRHRAWTMPETIYRACQDDVEIHGRKVLEPRPPQTSCIKDWEPVDALMSDWADYKTDNLSDAIEWYLERGRQLYAALVDAGIPWQDARRVLWMGTQTYIHDVYNYLALKGVLSKRLELIMDWEHVCVAQLMLREVNMKCPPIFGRYLKSASDAAGRAMFAGLESWPPDGKYPNPHERCKVCGHAAANHTEDLFPVAIEARNEPPQTGCEVCLRSSALGIEKAMHPYIGKDTLPRTHRPEQNPFWVLHPDSVAGHRIIGWVATNGVYPKEFPALTECAIVIQP